MRATRDALSYAMPIALMGSIGIQGRVGGFDFRATRPVLRDETGQPFELDCRLGPVGSSLSTDRGTCLLLAHLDAAGGPEAAFAARSIRRLVGHPETLPLLDGRGAWCLRDLRYHAQEPNAAARRSQAAEWPGFALLRARDTAGLRLSGNPVDALTRALRLEYPAGRFDESVVARIGKGAVQPGNLAPLAALATIPRDWVPWTPVAILEFIALAVATQRLARAMGGYGFLLSSKGRWDTFGEQVRRWARRDIEAITGWAQVAVAASDTLDMARTFQRQALFPSMADRNPDRLDDVAARVAQEEWMQSVPWAGARTLFAGKGLPAILELSDSWHRHQERMEDAIHGLEQSTVSWPVPFQPVTAPNGVEIRFLSRRSEMRAEGSGYAYDGSQGLDHCVLTRTHAVQTGARAVASLRIRTATGFQRLSTVEFDADFSGGDAEVVQHRGRRNATPPKAARTALSWFVREVVAQRILPDPAFLPSHRRPAPKEGAAAGLDVLSRGRVGAAVAAWSPYLPRPLRSVASLAAHPVAWEMPPGTAGRRYGLTNWEEMADPDSRLLSQVRRPDGTDCEHDPNDRASGYVAVAAWPAMVMFRGTLRFLNRIALRMGFEPCTGVTGTLASIAARRFRPVPASSVTILALAGAATLASVSLDAVIAYVVGGIPGVSVFMGGVASACAWLGHDRGCGPDRVRELARIMAEGDAPPSSLVVPEPDRDDQRVAVG